MTDMEKSKIMGMLETVSNIQDGLHMIPITAYAMKEGYYPDELAQSALDYLKQCLSNDVDKLAEGLNTLLNTTV